MDLNLGKVSATWHPVKDDDEIYDIIPLMKLCGKLLLLIEEENVIDYSNIVIKTFRGEDNKINLNIQVDVMKFETEDDDDEEEYEYEGEDDE